MNNYIDPNEGKQKEEETQQEQANEQAAGG
jgi:hypothetical protein